jgi:hypothetical protein
VPTTIEALVIVALVLAPDFIFTQIARRVIAHIQEPTDVRFLLTIISTGTAYHAFMFPWTSRILDYYLAVKLPGHRWEVFCWSVLTVFIVPLALGILVGRMSLWGWVERLLDQIGLGYLDRMPSAWDFVMHQQEPRYVRIHLKDGMGVVGGVFANQSFGSLDRGRGDLYLEQAWYLDDDGNFEQAVMDGHGVWIPHDVMAYVYFLERWEEPNGTQQLKAGDEGVADSPRHREVGGTAEQNRQQAGTASNVSQRSRRVRRPKQLGRKETRHKRAYLDP